MKAHAFAFTLLFSASALAQTPPATKLMTEANSTAAKLGTAIPVSFIGLPVSAITLNAPKWRPGWQRNERLPPAFAGGLARGGTSLLARSSTKWVMSVWLPPLASSEFHRSIAA